MLPALRHWLTMVAVLLGFAGLHACANSILGNATEAGLETVLDKPAPTPTLSSR